MNAASSTSPPQAFEQLVDEIRGLLSRMEELTAACQESDIRLEALAEARDQGHRVQEEAVEAYQSDVAANVELVAAERDRLLEPTVDVQAAIERRNSELGTQADELARTILSLVGTIEEQSGKQTKALRAWDEALTASDQRRNRHLNALLNQRQEMTTLDAELDGHLQQGDDHLSRQLHVQQDDDEEERLIQARAWNVEAIRLYNARQPRAALLLLRRALDLAPQDVTLWLNAASVCLALEMRAEADESLAQAVALGASGADVEHLGGLIQMLDGDARGAFDQLEMCASRAPDIVPYQASLARVAYIVDRAQACERAWHRILSDHPVARDQEPLWMT